MQNAMNKRQLLQLLLDSRIGPNNLGLVWQATRLAGLEFTDLPNLSSKDLLVRLGLKTNLVDALQNIFAAGFTAADEELCFVEKHKIRLISLEDEDYPCNLRQLACPPPLLYCRGRINFANRYNLAIVGSRHPDAYAARVLHSLVPDLLSQGWTLVSGGAIGVDALVHQFCLENNGPTTVVLGSGLLQPYPGQNLGLFDKLVDQGSCLVSILPLNAPPLPHHFPMRNQIIAGLSLGVVVVQAKAKSGALITASQALEEGREVFAIPGQIDNPLSYGPLHLLSQGAGMVRSADDIAQAFALNWQGFASSIVIKAEDKPLGLMAEKAVRDTLLGRADSVIPDGFSVQLWQALQEPKNLEDLIDLQPEIDVQWLATRLFALELEGRVHQDFAGCWQRNDKK